MLRHIAIVVLGASGCASTRDVDTRFKPAAYEWDAEVPVDEMFVVEVERKVGGHGTMKTWSPVNALQAECSPKCTARVEPRQVVVIGDAIGPALLLIHFEDPQDRGAAMERRVHLRFVAPSAGVLAIGDALPVARTRDGRALAGEHAHGDVAEHDVRPRGRCVERAVVGALHSFDCVGGVEVDGRFVVWPVDMPSADPPPPRFSLCITEAKGAATSIAMVRDGVLVDVEGSAAAAAYCAR